MTENVFFRSDLTAEILSTFYDEAGFKVTVDKDGDLEISNTDGRSCLVLLSKSGPDRISWISFWRGNTNADDSDKLLYVNKVNQELIGPKTWLNGSGGISFLHVLFLDGGVTRKSIVNTAYRFLSLESSAITLDENDVIG